MFFCHKSVQNLTNFSENRDFRNRFPPFWGFNTKMFLILHGFRSTRIFYSPKIRGEWGLPVCTFLIKTLWKGSQEQEGSMKSNLLYIYCSVMTVMEFHSEAGEMQKIFTSQWAYSIIQTRNLRFRSSHEIWILHVKKHYTSWFSTKNFNPWNTGGH